MGFVMVLTGDWFSLLHFEVTRAQLGSSYPFAPSIQKDMGRQTPRLMDISSHTHRHTHTYIYIRIRAHRDI